MKKGFTLVELILYVAIFTLMMTSLIPFAWNIIGGGIKSTTQQEISSNARYISEIIKYEIRRASGITSISSSTISLANFAPDTSTVIAFSGGNITISKNGGVATRLNSSETTISSFTFTDYSSGSSTKNIQFAFTIDSNFNQTRKEYQGTLSIEGAAEVRSN